MTDTVEERENPYKALISGLYVFSQTMLEEFYPLTMSLNRREVDSLHLDEGVFTAVMQQWYATWNEKTVANLPFPNFPLRLRFAALISSSLYYTQLVSSSIPAADELLRKVNAQLALDLGWAIVYTTHLHPKEEGRVYAEALISGVIRLHEHPLNNDMVKHLASQAPTRLELLLFFYVMMKS
ncbi:MAG: hypothetical protein HQM04_13015 [Magnetococcales bacterium]|nr:hypothetical protein [Magnetococcales bacterium]MBF0115947.1 hypothetical protein [Magnetococcales bacterium]